MTLIPTSKATSDVGKTLKTKFISVKIKHHVHAERGQGENQDRSLKVQRDEESPTRRSTRSTSSNDKPQ